MPGFGAKSFIIAHFTYRARRRTPFVRQKQFSSQFYSNSRSITMFLFYFKLSFQWKKAVPNKKTFAKPKEKKVF